MLENKFEVKKLSDQDNEVFIWLRTQRRKYNLSTFCRISVFFIEKIDNYLKIADF